MGGIYRVRNMKPRTTIDFKRRVELALGKLQFMPNKGMLEGIRKEYWELVKGFDDEISGYEMEIKRVKRLKEHYISAYRKALAKTIDKEKVLE